MTESPESSSSHHQKEGVGVESRVLHRINLLLLYLMSLLSTCSSSFRKSHQMKYILAFTSPVRCLTLCPRSLRKDRDFFPIAPRVSMAIIFLFLQLFIDAVPLPVATSYIILCDYNNYYFVLQTSVAPS